MKLQNRIEYAMRETEYFLGIFGKIVRKLSKIVQNIDYKLKIKDIFDG